MQCLLARRAVPAQALVAHPVSIGVARTARSRRSNPCDAISTRSTSRPKARGSTRTARTSSFPSRMSSVAGFPFIRSAASSASAGSSSARRLLGACCAAGISVHYMTEGGRFLARVEGPVSGNVLLRRTQYRWADEPARRDAIIKSIVAGKILNQRAVSDARGPRSRRDDGCRGPGRLVGSRRSIGGYRQAHGKTPRRGPIAGRRRRGGPSLFLGVRSSRAWRQAVVQPSRAAAAARHSTRPMHCFRSPTRS